MADDLEKLFALIAEAKRMARALDYITVSYLLDLASLDLSERSDTPHKEPAHTERRRRQAHSRRGAPKQA